MNSILPWIVMILLLAGLVHSIRTGWLFWLVEKLVYGDLDWSLMLRKTSWQVNRASKQVCFGLGAILTWFDQLEYNYEIVWLMKKAAWLLGMWVVILLTGYVYWGMGISLPDAVFFVLFSALGIVPFVIWIDHQEKWQHIVVITAVLMILAMWYTISIELF
jgi:hypothetical protein